MPDEFWQSVFSLWPKKPNARQTFRLGDAVRVKSGPLAYFTGRVEGINQAKSLLKVSVTVLGRERRLKLSFSEVDRVSAL